MLPGIRIVACDQDCFTRLVERDPEVQAYKRGQSLRCTPRQQERSLRASSLLSSEFQFLLICAYPFSSWRDAPEGPDARRFCCAIEDADGQEKLAGFTAIGHFPGRTLSPVLLDHMASLENASLRELGYDCITAVSVRTARRGRGISRLLLKSSADCIRQRHEARGGNGPALVKLSSFETLGRERLLGQLERMAQSRDDVVIGLGDGDAEELGLWIQGPADLDLSCTRQPHL